MSKRRYQVQWTPVGWHVIDTAETHDPIAEYGLGKEEYERAKQRAGELNEQDALALREP